MKLDTILPVTSLAEVASYAHAAEEMGFDALWTPENQHEPFMPLAVAATTTQQVKLGTSIALAFTLGRNSSRLQLQCISEFLIYLLQQGRRQFS